jgi:hypothetical protein
MADQNANPNGKGGANADANVPTPEQISEWQAKAGKYDKAAQIADELGFSEPDEAIDNLSVLAFEKSKNEKPEDKKPEPKPEDKSKVNEPAPDPRIEASLKTGAKAFYESLYTQYQLDQRDLPEDQRDGLSKDDLIKIAFGPKAAYLEQIAAQEFGGNIWKAAAFTKKYEEGLRAAKTNQANASAAIDKSKNQNRVEAGAEAPNSPGPADANAKRLDEIAPKTVYKRPSSYAT